jgi:serine/threonine protein kinase
MNVVVKYCSSRMLSTNTPDQAADLYREASKIPRSVTQVELAQQHISIGQLFPDSASSKSVILEAFDAGSPCLLKVTDEESLNHEMRVWEAIEAGGGASDHHLVPLKKLPFERQARVDRGEFSGGILMQKYQSTLARCKIPLTEEVLLRYGNQLLTAITKMHECGYCHMDIKPSNVFLWQGNCLLGDYGGASRPGEKVRQQTHSYYPDGAGEEAKEETDFLLLAVMLLEMFGCVTSPPGPMTKDEIKSRVASVGNEKVKAFLVQLVV